MQGGAVCRALLARGHAVRAFVRDPRSSRAAELATLGAELASGDFDQPASVAASAHGCSAIFVLGTPFEAGVDTETRQAIAVVDAAHAAGIPHVVYSSVANANARTGIPHFESKRRVEEHLERSSIPYTIVAPVNFRENFRGAAEEGALAMPLSPQRELQTISAPELGAFVAAIIEAAPAHLRQRIDLGSDATTGVQMAEAIARASGRSLGFVPLEPGTDDGDMTRMWRWFEEVGYSADVAGLRAAFPALPWTTFAGWAAAQRW